MTNVQPIYQSSYPSYSNQNNQQKSTQYQSSQVTLVGPKLTEDEGTRRQGIRSNSQSIHSSSLVRHRRSLPIESAPRESRFEPGSRALQLPLCVTGVDISHSQNVTRKPAENWWSTDYANAEGFLMVIGVGTN